MTFNEWRHRHSSYDNRLRGARTPDAQRAVMESIAMQAMQIAVASQDKVLAAQVMAWAIAKRIVEVV
jgi:hypothetical protein